VGQTAHTRLRRIEGKIEKKAKTEVGPTVPIRGYLGKGRCQEMTERRVLWEGDTSPWRGKKEKKVEREEVGCQRSHHHDVLQTAASANGSGKTEIAGE